MKDNYTKIVSTEEFNEILQAKSYFANEKKTRPFNNKKDYPPHILNWGDKLLCTDTEITCML